MHFVLLLPLLPPPCSSPISPSPSLLPLSCLVSPPPLPLSPFSPSPLLPSSSLPPHSFSLSLPPLLSHIVTPPPSSLFSYCPLSLLCPPADLLGHPPPPPRHHHYHHHRRRRCPHNHHRHHHQHQHHYHHHLCFLTSFQNICRFSFLFNRLFQFSSHLIVLAFFYFVYSHVAFSCFLTLLSERWCHCDN